MKQPLRNSFLVAFLVLATIGTTGLVHADTTAAEPTIMLKAFTFTPAEVTVRAGTTVTWRNLDEEPHTVVSTTGAFRSDALDTNDSFRFAFDKPGEYSFICSIHPHMRGKVIVTK